MKTDDVPKAEKDIVAEASFKENKDATLGFVPLCTADVANGKGSATIDFKTIIYRTTRSEKDGIIVWSNPTHVVLDGKMITHGPDNIKTAGYVPAKFKQCSGWDTSVAAPKYDMKKVAEQLSGNYDAMVAQTNFTNALSKSLEITVEGCRKVLVIIDQMKAVGERKDPI